MDRTTGGQPTWRDEEITLRPYDPQWPNLFAQEVDLLTPVIGAWVTGGIHHVGSTAVPDLLAKPVIDILVGVESLADSRPSISALASLDYLYAPYRADEMHWLCKPDPSHRTHHLHLVPTGSVRFSDELAFRDYLRTHPDRVRAYAGLKEQVAARHRHDREAYTAAKAPFIVETLQLAHGSAGPSEPAAPA